MAINLQNIAPEQTSSKKSAAKQSGGVADFLNRDIQLFSRGLNDKKKERFYGGLAILFASGVDIRTVLDLIEDEQNSKSDRAIFGAIRQHIMKGGTFTTTSSPPELRDLVRK